MKNSMSKILAVLVAVTIILAVVPLGIFTATALAYTPEEIYTFQQFNTEYGEGVAITGVTEHFKGGDVTLPATLNEQPVVTISNDAFYNNQTITSVTIPEGVALMQSWAFAFCENLKSVSLPASLKQIYPDAFYGSNAIESVKVAAGNTAYSVAGNCLIDTAEKAIVIGFANSVIPTDSNVATKIRAYAFENNANFTDLAIPDNITFIGDGAFAHCENLKSVKLPNGIAEVIYWAFEGCEKLTTVDIPSSVKAIRAGAFWDCESLETITLPSGLTKIEYSAFSNCKKLKGIDIPASVTTIGDYAFKDCEAIAEIDVPATVTEILYGTFDGCKKLAKVGLPASVTSIVYNAFNKCEAITDVYYAGNETQKAAIKIDAGNDALTKATWHYNALLHPPVVKETPAAPAAVKVVADTGIAVAADKAFAAGTVVTAKRVTEGDIYKGAAVAMQGVAKKFQVFEFDATLNGAKVQPNGKVAVTFDLPDGYSAKKLKMFYVKDGKITEEVKITIDTKNKKVTAELSHFSTYVLAEATSSHTSDSSNYEFYLLFAGIVLAAYTVISFGKKQYDK